MWTEKFQMFKLDLEKEEEPEIKAISIGSYKNKRIPEKNIYFFVDDTKAFDCEDHHKL